MCETCGRPLISPGICTNCQIEKPAFKALRSWSIFADPIKEAIHRLKYYRDVALGDLLADQMLEFLCKLNWSLDAVIPVPLGKARLNERGYNQAGLIARPLAAALDLEYSPKCLTRPKETRTQVGLTREERRKNVQGAFQAAKQINEKIVLIVDDVATTGSTMSSCAEALYAAGAREVYALTVARALPQKG